MNLALESLIRNKVIENSFHTQCSIAVWDEFKNNPLWITVKKEETSDKFLITHWRIDLFQEVDCINYKSNDDYELPISTYFLVSSENLFKPNKVIPKGAGGISDPGGNKTDGFFLACFVCAGQIPRKFLRGLNES